MIIPTIYWDVLTNVTILLVATFIHELGHYVSAKSKKTYVGWGLFPLPHIKEKVTKDPTTYYMGFLFSVPFLMFFYSPAFTLLYAILLAFGDWINLLFWLRWKKTLKWGIK
jgi:hypothetical protein